MNALGFLVVLSGPVLAIAWMISEFKAQRKLRLILGVLALLVATVVTWFATLFLTRFNYNAWYGFAAKGLIEEVVTGIESGHTSEVLTELKRLQEDFHPTYENRAGFAPLVEAASGRLHEVNQDAKTAPTVP